MKRHRVAEGIKTKEPIYAAHKRLTSPFWEQIGLKYKNGKNITANRYRESRTAKFLSDKKLFQETMVFIE